MTMPKYALIVIIGALLTTVIYTTITYSNDSKSSDYSIFYESPDDNCKFSTDWNLIIFIDTNSCLECTEDMNYWKEAEDIFLKNNCTMSIWAPRSDFQDVSIAMQLENIKTPVHILESNHIASFGWIDKRTPIKFLFDKYGQPIEVFEANNNKEQSRKTFGKILAKLN